MPVMITSGETGGIEKAAGGIQAELAQFFSYSIILIFSIFHLFKKHSV